MEAIEQFKRDIRTSAQNILDLGGQEALKTLLEEFNIRKINQISLWASTDFYLRLEALEQRLETGEKHR